MSCAEVRSTTRLCGFAILTVVTAALAAGCSGATLGSATPTVTSGEERNAVPTMRVWLRSFRSEQRRYFQIHRRYAYDSTIDGSVEVLPPPYDTAYEVSPPGNRYSVRVRHPNARQVCKLEEGEGAFDPGDIVCTAY